MEGGKLLTHRGRGSATIVVGNDVTAAIAENACTAVGSAEINADHRGDDGHIGDT